MCIFVLRYMFVSTIQLRRDIEILQMHWTSCVGTETGLHTAHAERLSRLTERTDMCVHAHTQLPTPHCEGIPTHVASN